MARKHEALSREGRGPRAGGGGAGCGGATVTRRGNGLACVALAAGARTAGATLYEPWAATRAAEAGAHHRAAALLHALDHLIGLVLGQLAVRHGLLDVGDPLRLEILLGLLQRRLDGRRVQAQVLRQQVDVPLLGRLSLLLQLLALLVRQLRALALAVALTSTRSTGLPWLPRLAGALGDQRRGVLAGREGWICCR